MGFTDVAGKAYETIKGLASIEARTQLLNFLNETEEVYREKRRIEEENRELREKLAFQGTLRFEENALWSGDSKSPYCVSCWESKQKAVHLVSRAMGYPECPTCKTEYIVDIEDQV